MGTKLNKIPKTEKELNDLLQDVYLVSKKNYEENRASNFTGLLEIIASEPNIITSIHRIKSHKGSKTAGIDSQVLNDYLQKGFDEVISEVRNRLYNYHPDKIRRVCIPKFNKKEKRSLGIPTIIDRIIQACIKNILEPIAEGQFFEHSYGFRPMRDAKMAVSRIKNINYHAKCYWVVEGDIKAFFNNIDHNIMIESLWNLGIRDKRVLCIIKEMLRAGVMDECETSELGTSQGGIISPLLANIYLNRFDNFITSHFERKKLRHKYSRRDGAIAAMRKRSTLKTCYYVRYADDWVILTDNRVDAEKLKYRAQKYLKDTLKLELSEDKTLITNVCSHPIKFLGVEISMYNKNGRLVNRVSPERIRFDQIMKNLKREIFSLRKVPTNQPEQLIESITRVNSIITGIANYYDMCDQINVILQKYAWCLQYTAYKSLKRFGGKWIRTDKVSNLIGIHSKHRAHIPAIKYKDMYIGVTDIIFTTWKQPKNKNQKENPYTKKGRELYNKRMRHKGLNVRIDEVNTSRNAYRIRKSEEKLYNFEYFMNRPYSYKRDKGKCKICNGYVEPNTSHFHHVNPNLPFDQVNKVNNLVTVHQYCHKLIHSNEAPSNLTEQSIKRLTKYRNQLSESNYLRINS